MTFLPLIAFFSLMVLGCISSIREAHKDHLEGEGM